MAYLPEKIRLNHEAGMKNITEKIVQDKKEGRVALARLSFADKIAIVEKLRERNRSIKGSRVAINNQRPTTN